MVGLLCVCVNYVYKVGKIVRGISRGALVLVECVNHVYKVVRNVRIVRGITGGGGPVSVSALYIIGQIVIIVRGFLDGGAALCV